MLNHGHSDAVFAVLGHATRRAIISRLAAGRATVTELAEPLGISRSAVLQHLEVLQNTRLVTSSKQGRVRTCELNPEGLKVATDWLNEHRRRWENRLDRLGELLNEE